MAQTAPDNVKHRKVRLIVKIIESEQTSLESWQDTTHYRAFDVAIGMELAELLDDGAIVVGAEIL